MSDQHRSQDHTHDHDQDRNGTDYAWIRHAYTATPTAPVAAIDATVTAVRDAVPDKRSMERTTAQGSRWTSQRPWVWHIPATATLLATVCAIIIWIDHHHTGHTGSFPKAATQIYANGHTVPVGAPLQRPSSSIVPPRLSSPPLDTIVPPVSSRPTPSANPTQNGTTVASMPPTTDGDSARWGAHAPTTTTPPSTPQEHAVEGLDPESATLVLGILDSARAHGLPIAALTARIQEGVHRGIPSPRIVAVTRNFARALTDARATLGASSTAAEIQVGAEALLNGVPMAALEQLRTARPSGSIAEPLLALVDLSAHGVAPLQASGVLAALLARHGSDSLVRTLRTEVIGNIIRGTAPNAALAVYVPHVDGHTPQHTQSPINRPDSIPMRQAPP